MELAQITFHQILMMVMLLGVGLVCAKTGIIDEHTNKNLSALLIKVITPIVVIVSFQREFDMELVRGLLLSLLLSIVAFAVMIPLAHFLFRDQDGVAYPIEKFATIYSNCGFIGIPLVNGVFGMEGVFYLTAFITLFNLLIFTHGVMIMSSSFSLKIMKKALLSPAIIGIAIGLILFVARWMLPEFILTPIQLISDMNTPLAMLVGGASMAGMHLPKMLKDKRIYHIAGLRLVAIPALLLVIFLLIPAPLIITGTVLIAASAPVATSLILFAYEYDKDALFASELFAASTLLSLVTLPILMIFI